MPPTVVAELPPHWVAAEIERPKIAESAGAELVGWRAMAAPGNEAGFVSGCVATPIPGWVEDMRPAIEARTTALAGATGERITGTPVDARSQADGALVLRPAQHLEAPPIGLSRTFLGFDDGRVFTCFATCGARHAGGDPTGCEAATRSAHLEGSRPPPAPGLALHGVTWAVHHPRPAASGGAALVAAAAVLAVVFRRRARGLRRAGRSG